MCFQCAFSGLPVAFQWSSSVFQLWKLNRIATWTPLGASISQCVSSGIPVYLWLQWSSNNVFQLFKLTLVCHKNTTGCYHQLVWFQWHPSVLVTLVVFQCGVSSGIPVFGGHYVRSLSSMQPLMYTTGLANVVWGKLISFELQPQIHKKWCSCPRHAQSDVEVLTRWKSRTDIHRRAVNYK